MLLFSLVATAQKITLPIEVLGAQGLVEEISLDLTAAQANSAKSIWMQVNNLGYENKASVKLNSGNWVDLNHNSVEIQSPEKERGGMAHGGYNTIRLHLPATGFVTGTNTIHFRFNRSDAISNGYRVIKFNLLDASETKILDASYFEEDDPMTWKSPYYDVENNKEPDDLAAKIAQGKNLWYYADLISSYHEAGERGFWYGYDLGEARPIKAKCASCHTQDGRDLELFSYSNKSIIERSKFHKLTEEEGKLIATYIRSLSEEHENVNRKGRPWNPPYQPGPELAGKPIDEWAAGAGLDAVLEQDKDMFPYLFPDGVDQEKVDAYFDSDKMPDRTEIPIAIQFPDWKHWLPMIHPMDAFTKGTFYNDTYTNRAPYVKIADNNLNPEKGYEVFRQVLLDAPKKADGVTIDMKGMSKSEVADLMEAHRVFRLNFRFYQGQGTEEEMNHWRTRSGLGLSSLADAVPQEFAATSMARLMGVKNFEFMQEFNLQDQAPDYIPAVDQPNKRQWFHDSDAKHIFEIPAHITGCLDDDCQSFQGQGNMVGQFESSNWYHLQSIIAGGEGNQSHNGPVDYNYQPQFILKASKISGHMEPLRFYQSLNTMYQTKTWSRGTNPNDGQGFRMRVMGPWLFFAKQPEGGKVKFYNFEPGFFPTTLDDVYPGLTKMVLNAQLKQFLKEMNKPENSIDTWYRYGSTYNGKVEKNKSNNLDPVGKTEIHDMTETYSSPEPLYADHMYWVLKEAQNLGVDCDVLYELLDWTKRAFPDVNTFTSGEQSNPMSWDEILLCTPSWDDDQDGVPNDRDACPNTLANAVVNEYGCIDLPENNFTIQTFAETCAGKDNGKISITPEKTLSYTLTFDGSDTDYNFTDELLLTDLAVGNHSFCITMSAEPSFKQCYNLTIAPAQEISGKAVPVLKGNAITENFTVHSGTAPYTVSKNGVAVLTTGQSDFSIDVAHGDRITVASKFECEGVFTTDVNLMELFKVVPNPAKDFVKVAIPDPDLIEVSAAIYNALQQRVVSKSYELKNGGIQISLQNLDPGMYFLRLELATPVVLKVLKE